MNIKTINLILMSRLGESMLIKLLKREKWSLNLLETLIQKKNHLISLGRITSVTQIGQKTVDHRLSLN